MMKRNWYEVGWGLITDGPDAIDTTEIALTWRVVGQCTHGHNMYEDPSWPGVAIDLGCDTALQRAPMTDDYVRDTFPTAYAMLQEDA